MFGGLGSAIGIGSSLAQGWLGAKGATAAANAASKWLQKGVNAQNGVWDQTQSNYSPYIQAGQQALSTYQDKLANAAQPTLGYTQEQFNFNKWQDPSAQYANAESGRALQATALAKGASGGGFAKALAQNQSNLANQAYSNAYDRFKANSQMMYGQAADQYNRDYTAQQNDLNRYSAMSDMGMNAASQLGGYGQQYATNMGNLYGQIGSAKAAGQAGKYNAWASALGGAAQNLNGYLGSLNSGMIGKNPYV